MLQTELQAFAAVVSKGQNNREDSKWVEECLRIIKITQSINQSQVKPH